MTNLLPELWISKSSPYFPSWDAEHQVDTYWHIPVKGCGLSVSGLLQSSEKNLYKTPTDFTKLRIMPLLG